MNHNPVALITGASSGIGKATAEVFVHNGWSVVVADVNDADGRALAQSLSPDGSRAVYVHCDVSSAADNQAAVQQAITSFGRLDAAVNNAGISGDLAPTADYPTESWNSVLAINLTGVFLGMKAQIPAMRKSGGGSIINVSSILGQVAFQGAPAYVAAKHGLVGLTRTAALDHAAENIRVNVIGPAFIETPMISGVTADPAMAAAIVAMHPIGRLGKPEEVAELILFLASSKSSFMTGNYYAVDGGYLAR
jgi:NAD(P)-dependent dehydrogenase (short-subunit alcohol dehydrogenase family)